MGRGNAASKCTTSRLPRVLLLPKAKDDLTVIERGQDVTGGVDDHGTHARGQPGNLGDPHLSSQWGRPEARETVAKADEDEGVGGLHRSDEVGEPRGSGTRPSKGGPSCCEPGRRNMANASTLGGMSPQLSKVVERARSEPEGRFHALAHLIDVPALKRAYARMRKDAAAGGDGITKEQYGQNLEEHLESLHVRMVAGHYRHRPILRVHIPKASGKTRPIGISVFEDKLVQDSVREVLEAVYEQDFLECSYGFRPGRSAHDAVRTLNRIVRQGEVRWILEADIQSFFDSLDRKMLTKLLQTRIADGSLLRLIGKCLHVGVLDGVEFSEPDTGTAQGSVLSPLLGNVYLHYALDDWFERQVKPRLRGKATLIRYADDFIMAFEHQDDARRVQAVLGKRLERFGLTLHPDKTRLLHFERPSKYADKGPGTFDFLGFTFYWRRTRTGNWGMACKTRSASLRRFITNVYSWCRRHRHQPIADQHLALRRRIQGHFNYFGVNGNFRSLLQVCAAAERSWFQWLRRRSDRKRMTWQRYQAILSRSPLPRPRIMVQIWGR